MSSNPGRHSKTLSQKRREKEVRKKEKSSESVKIETARQSNGPKRSLKQAVVYAATPTHHRYIHSICPSSPPQGPSLLQSLPGKREAGASGSWPLWTLAAPDLPPASPLRLQPLSRCFLRTSSPPILSAPTLSLFHACWLRAPPSSAPSAANLSLPSGCSIPTASTTCQVPSAPWTL